MPALACARDALARHTVSVRHAVAATATLADNTMQWRCGHAQTDLATRS